MIPKPKFIPKYFAHRGIASEENTVSGFLKALEMGADGIELDVHFYHDRLKVTHYKTLVGRKSVPYFEDVLEMIEHKCKQLKRQRPILNIDLKSRGAGKVLLQQIKGWDVDNFLVSSFMVLSGDSRVRYQELLAVREINSKIPIGIITYANEINLYIKFVEELKACAIISKWHKDKYTKEFVSAVHKHNLYSIPWNITDEESCEDAMKKGADGVIKDVYQEKKEVV